MNKKLTADFQKKKNNHEKIRFGLTWYFFIIYISYMYIAENNENVYYRFV